VSRAARAIVRSRRGVVIVLLALPVVVALTTFAAAASLGLTAHKLTTWHAAASCAAGTQTLSATADSYIDQNSTGANFGTVDLRVKAPLLSLGVDVGGKRWTLVRFTLPAVPDLCSVSATLRLYATSADPNRTLQVRTLDASWTEAGVTWANQPGLTGATDVTITSGSTAGYRQWDVSSLYSLGANGFLVRDITPAALLGPEQIYSSRSTGTNHPELVVTFS
jgi:hypothetical protein